MLHQNQLRHALQIINNYEPVMPLHHFLRNYFRLNKGFGSRDRRLYRQIVYSYYRTGTNFIDWGQQVKLVLSAFLVAEKADAFLEYWLDEITPFAPADVELPLEKKFTKLKEAGYVFSDEKLFPWKHLLGNISSVEDFVKSHLRQPYTWIKVHKNNNAILSEAEKEGIVPIQKTADAIAFAPTADVTRFKSFEKGYFEVQDLSSQKTIQLMQPKAGEKWWDCCAGAGGKSLLLKNFTNIELLATDVRASILQNLNERALRHNYKIETAEVNLAEKPLGTTQMFDGIMVDAPCTGSGTWSRNPERVNFFSEQEIEKYTSLQKQILINAVQNLRSGGRLVYLTCSVFKGENELIIEWLKNNTGLNLKEAQYFEGFNTHADTLFGTLLVKPIS